MPKEWKFGTPEAELVSRKNLEEWDRVRRVLISRCDSCDQVISNDPDKVKEIYLAGTGRTQRLCDVCYTFHQSLYFNGKLKNMNYYRHLDEADEKAKDETKKRRKRLGLDDDNTQT